MRALIRADVEGVHAKITKGYLTPGTEVEVMPAASVQRALAVLGRRYERPWHDIDRDFLADLIGEAIDCLGRIEVSSEADRP